jgi:hypothetical protein
MKKPEEIDSKIINSRFLARRSRHGEIHGAEERVSVIGFHVRKILRGEKFGVDMRIRKILAAKKMWRNLGRQLGYCRQ